MKRFSQVTRIYGLASLLSIGLMPIAAQAADLTATRDAAQLKSAIALDTPQESVPSTPTGPNSTDSPSDSSDPATNSTPESSDSPLSPISQEDAIVAQATPSAPSQMSETVEQERSVSVQPQTPSVPTLISDNSLGNVPSVANLDSNQSLGQVTSVSQLSDVRPTDWAFQALQSLVERYGCIAGYPDKTFRGNRAMTRYEFAAGLNACMDRVNEIIAAGQAGLATQEDLATLKRLQDEFSRELTVLRGRIDGLEGRTATLEKHQFSTTTKLSGVVIMGLQGRSSGKYAFFPTNGPADTDDPGTKTTFTYNAQLNLTTQLSPRTLLLIGLQAGRGSSAPFLSNDVRLGYEAETNGSLQISDLTVRHLIGKNLAIIAGTEGVNMVSTFRGPNRVEGAAFGPISAFAQRNPILNIGAGRSGVGFDWQIGSRVSLQGVYASGNAESPAVKSGLFDGRTTAGLQLSLAPSRNLDIALNYVNSYNPDGDLATGIGDTRLTPNGEPINTNAFGGTVSWRVSPKFTVGGWAGWTSSKIPERSGNVETFNWMAFMNFPDLFGRGNLGGIYVGQPPRITSSDLPSGLNIPDLLNGGLGESGGQKKATTHVEAFYRWRVSDNISITPGVMAIFNPGNSNSDTVVVGAIRTTFSF